MSLTGHTGIQLAVLSTSFGPGRKKRARHSRRAEMQLVHQAKATPASVVRVGNLSRAYERPEASMTQNSRVVRKAKGAKTGSGSDRSKVGCGGSGVPRAESANGMEQR